MLGVILSLMTAVLFGLSVAVFKHAMASHEKFSVKAIIRHKVWLAGLGVGLVGVVTYIFAMALAPLTTVQPVASFSTVIPILAGAFIFKEKMGGMKWLFVAVLTVGIILVSLS